MGLTVLAIYFLCREWADAPSNEPVPSDDDTSSLRKNLFTAATWLLALVYLVMGLPKLGALSDITHQFQHWGYSQTFIYLIGALEFLSAIVLLVPRLRLYASVVLSVVMTGAVYTHLAFDPAAYIAMPITCLAMLIFVSYESYRREWRDSKDFQEAAR